MKKILNKKGFAITSFLYSIFLLAVLFFILILLIVANSSTNFFKFQKSVKKDLDEVSYSTGGINNLYKIVFEVEKPVIQKGENFDFLQGVKLLKYDGTELNNTISYTVTPTFDNNKAGKYLITYQATVDDNVIKKNRVLIVQEPLIYVNGQRVYFDVYNGTGCSMEDYVKSYDVAAGDFLNSKTGYNGLNGTGKQNNCLLFYAFNDDGGETVDLILDHNTTENVYWTEENVSYNTAGPIMALDGLRNATDNWNGTIIPLDYSVYQAVDDVDAAFVPNNNVILMRNTYSFGGQIIYGDYTIPYKTEEYKARLITADEVAQIVGNNNGIDFDESTSDYNSWFLFDEYDSLLYKQFENGTLSYDNYVSQIEEYFANNEAENAWLYDRTSKNCVAHGCLNNSFGDNDMYGYWTGTSVLGNTDSAWSVENFGALNSFSVDSNNSGGVRPVITVLKSKITPGVAPIIPNME